MPYLFLNSPVYNYVAESSESSAHITSLPGRLWLNVSCRVIQSENSRNTRIIKYGRLCLDSPCLNIRTLLATRTFRSVVDVADLAGGFYDPREEYYVHLSGHCTVIMPANHKCLGCACLRTGYVLAWLVWATDCILNASGLRVLCLCQTTLKDVLNTPWAISSSQRSITPSTMYPGFRQGT